MNKQDEIVAIGFLNPRDVQRLGSKLQKVYVVDETPCFAKILDSLDDAETSINPKGSSLDRLPS